MDGEYVADLQQFYSLLARVEAKTRGVRLLADCSGRLKWPARGVYFFLENGEIRSNSGAGPRVVRVGTHGLKAHSASTLWSRLSQHRGQSAGLGGNHRGSIFRLLVGASLKAQRGYDFPTWGIGNTAPNAIRLGEAELEREVSQTIGAMPFLWLAINDEPGPNSLRGFVERNAIALLSNHGKAPIDPASPNWLGGFSDRERVRLSGLWNSNHVDERYDPAFLGVVEQLVTEMEVTS
jgi:hypothetical protein